MLFVFSDEHVIDMEILSAHVLQQSYGGTLFDAVGSGFISLFIGASVGLLLNSEYRNNDEQEQSCYSQGFSDGFVQSQKESL